MIEYRFRHRPTRPAVLHTVALALLLFLGVRPAQGSDPRRAGTREMMRELSTLGRDFDLRLVEQQADPDIARYCRHVRKGVDERSRVLLELQEGYRLLVNGDARSAVERFLDVERRACREPEFAADHQLVSIARSYAALASLRQGEQENCVMHHTSQSCLLPIRGNGTHSMTEGARTAREVYARILEQNPSDLTSRWLFNVSSMALGAYPDSVPKSLLIEPSLYAAEDSMPQFEDVAPALGIATRGLTGGCVMDDFDGDGSLDIMVSSFGLDPVRDAMQFLVQDSRGHFTDRTEEAGLSGLVGGSNLVQADFDNDGHLDVLVLRGGGLLGKLGCQPPSLLRNRGDGTFEDVTRRSGVYFLAAAQSATWADFDADGWLDLFVGVQYSELATFEIPLWRAFEPAPRQSCKLFHNQHDGTFREVAATAGVAFVGMVSGVASGDLDEDGLPDLVLAQRYGPALVYHNEGGSPLRFQRTQVLEPNHCGALCLLDADGDGHLDLFVSGYTVGASGYAAGLVAADYLGLPSTAERPRLYRNLGRGWLEDVTPTSGLGRAIFATGLGAGDFDGDGRTDLFVGTGSRDYRALLPDRMFRNVGGSRFADVTRAADVGHLQKAGAVAVGDLDGDGDEDIYIKVGGEFPGDAFRSVLFRNPGAPNHHLTLRLEGTHTNRSAIGARVRVIVTESGHEREQFATVSTGSSFGGSSLQLEIGIGNATGITAVEVQWPGGGLERYRGARPDCVLTLREGSGTPVAARDSTPLRGTGIAGGEHVR